MYLWCLHFLPKKRTKTSRQVLKSNLFVRFLEEFVWPLETCRKIYKMYYIDLFLNFLSSMSTKKVRYFEISNFINCPFYYVQTRIQNRVMKSSLQTRFNLDASAFSRDICNKENSCDVNTIIKKISWKGRCMKIKKNLRNYFTLLWGVTKD